MMNNYTNINQLIDDVKNGLFDSIDFDRERNIDSVIKQEMIREMKTDNSTYRFHKFVNIPVIGILLMTRRINIYTEWIQKIFPNERCIQIANDTKQDIIDHSLEYEKAFLLLDDDSKNKYLSLLCMKLYGDFRYILPFYSLEAQYFSKKIEWKDHPNVVDGGGFIGDTLLTFLNKGIVPGEYYIYELEDNNYKSLLKNIKIAENKGVKITVRKKGIYSKDDKLYFIADRDSSKLVDYPTDDSIDVVKIDSDVKMTPDFIKMDIEGSEVEAIKGAENLIKKYSPTLAICIYHLKDDFWKIPLLIKSINPEYNNFWIEHYQLGYNETVLYVSK